MAEREPSVSTSSPTSRAVASSTAADRSPFDRAKRHVVVACAAIAGGLAVAGSVDRTTGGVLVVVGWIAGVASLHRLGRTGSDRG
ncbi:MAG: hypothetical protein KF795_27480 [Labilithrix sp.]|nr:hypothetical protein [Labilithrix sp.]